MFIRLSLRAMPCARQRDESAQRRRRFSHAAFRAVTIFTRFTDVSPRYADISRYAFFYFVDFLASPDADASAA